MPHLHRYHHGDLRAAVLRRAEETLRASGVDGLSLRRIAREIGVSHGAPSRHFRDKRALLDALAMVGFERLGSAFRDALAEETGNELGARLRELARAYLGFAVENSALLELMFTRKHDSSAGVELAEAGERAFEAPVEVIVAAQRAGEVVPGDPRGIGVTAIAALQGLATLLGSGFVTGEADALLEETVGHLLHGLRPRS